MNICLLGATGRVGSIILENALVKKDNVRALVRDSRKLKAIHSNLFTIEGNIFDYSLLLDSMIGCEAVISSLNTGGNDTLSKSMPLIIAGMKETGINRIITVGTAGILQARSQPGLYRFQSSESKRKSTRDAEDHLKAYLLLKESGLEWTIVCPTYLPVGERVGRYRIEKSILPDNPTSISIYDTGDFTYSQLFTDEFKGFRVGLTY